LFNLSSEALITEARLRYDRLPKPANFLCVVLSDSKSMTTTALLRPYLLAIGSNLCFFLWAWLGVNHGKGLFSFTTDEIGLMFLLPLVIVLNAGFWVLFLGMDKRAFRKAFGFTSLLLLGGGIAVWVHAYLTGVTS
jgi:hypothetical protein